MDRARLVTLFRHWGDVEATANLSPLYAVFGHAVADDDELLDLANEALPGQPPPNVLFAAVHAVLAQSGDEPLREYYASLGGSREADARAAEMLHDFCGRRREELLPIIRTRLTQTNEVRRSAVLLPAFASVAAESGDLPLSLIEIGPSAGLNLLFDKYQYDYGDARAGATASNVVLDCELRGAQPPLTIPAIAARCGIDINPLDIENEADVEWLRALLWPEHVDRLALLNAAIAVARSNPPELFRGDVLDLLPQQVSEAPRGSVVCILATFVLNQLPESVLTDLRTMLLELSTSREIFMVVMGFSEFVVPGTPRVGDTMVWMLRCRSGRGTYRLLAYANPHGRWLDWQSNSEWKDW
ncbi:MAG: DUF2332 domain-containing protein [bacterium]